MAEDTRDRDGGASKALLSKVLLVVMTLFVPAGIAWCSWVSVKIVEIGVRMESHSNLRADFTSLKADLDVLRASHAKQTTEIELLKLKTINMPRAPRPAPIDDQGASIILPGTGDERWLNSSTTFSSDSRSAAASSSHTRS